MTSFTATAAENNLSITPKRKSLWKVFLWCIAVWVAVPLGIYAVVVEARYYSAVEKIGYPRVNGEVSDYTLGELNNKNLLIVMNPINGSSTAMGFAVSANGTAQILGRSRMGTATPSSMQGRLVPTGIRIKSSLEEETGKTSVCIETIGCSLINPENGNLTQKGTIIGKITQVVPANQLNPNYRF